MFSALISFIVKYRLILLQIAETSVFHELFEIDGSPLLIFLCIGSVSLFALRIHEISVVLESCRIVLEM